MNELFHAVARVVCGKPDGEGAEACYQARARAKSFCGAYPRCRIAEMTDEQLTYVVHPLDQKSYLKACPGSGKTEAVALKAAYALRAQSWSYSGIAFLSFTNHAADVIQERVTRSSPQLYPHYIGTFNSWLHAYLLNPFGWRVMKYPGKENDRSVRIVEAGSEAAFLNAFQTKYNYAKTGPVRANEFFLEESRIVFDSANDGADAARNTLTLAEWQVKDLMDAKARFWKSGFATHQDVEVICYLILRDFARLRALVSQRFPFFVIDECQDLCPSQLQLLGELRKAGTHVHLVGDLNQAIFSFRGSDPVALLKHIEQEKFLPLTFTKNFRSVQPVVDLCGRLIGEAGIQGRPPVSQEPACVYFSYADASDLPLLPGKFQTWLEQRGLDPTKCAVIARGYATLEKLRGRQAEQPRAPAHQVAAAVSDWKSNDVASRRKALKHFGAAVAARHFTGESSDANAYHRPYSVESNVEWRLFLAAALDRCLAQPELVNFDQTWTDWTAAARQYLPLILAAAWKSQPALATAASPIRAPHGKAKKSVTETLAPNSGPPVRLHFTNIHQVKGETFDAVLVVSSPNKLGDGGHWLHWLDPNPDHAEHRRFAYVASSRPRLVLAWAILAPGEPERQRLAQLGFVAG